MEQGVCQASLSFLGDTPDLVLTLRYLVLNLALIGPRGCILRVREPGVRKGLQDPGVPGDTVTLRYWVLVGPWQYQCSGAGWGWVVPRYSTLPVLPSRTTPGTPQTRHTAGTSVGAVPQCGRTCSLAATKEILGVNNAQVYSGHAVCCVGLLPPPYAHCSSALPWRLLRP